MYYSDYINHLTSKKINFWNNDNLILANNTRSIMRIINIIHIHVYT